MLNRIKQLKRLWDLSHKDKELFDEMANMISDQERISLENGLAPLSRKTYGNGKATFIPYMNETERNEYLKNQEPVWRKFNERLKEIIK